MEQPNNKLNCFMKAVLIFTIALAFFTSCGDDVDKAVVKQEKVEVDSKEKLTKSKEEAKQVSESSTEVIKETKAQPVQVKQDISPKEEEPPKAKSIFVEVKEVKGEDVPEDEILIADESSDVIVKQSGEIVKKNKKKQSGSMFTTSKYRPGTTAVEIYKAEQINIVKAYQDKDWISFNESRKARELLGDWGRDTANVDRPYFGAPFDSLDMRAEGFKASREKYIKLIQSL